MFYCLFQLTEFELLETLDGKPLMNKYQKVAKALVDNRIVCNAQPYRNGSDRNNAILALTILTQLVRRMVFELRL